jgi:hypothetical protein
MPTQKKASQSTASKAGEFDVISSFNLGYRNREDKTNLPPQTLVTGSQNVLTNVYGRISARKGYTLDGAADTSISSILASYDYEMHTGETRHLRAGFLTSAANDGKLQYRYVAVDGTVTWIDLLTGLTSTSFNFADYWDTTALQSRLLMVNGASSITEWSGGVTTFASATANTITKEGAEAWAEVGFSPTGVHTVVIAGVAYGATGGWGTTTLTGVTPNPSTPAYAAGVTVHQAPETTLNSAMTDLPSIGNDLIANLRNQIYVASLTNNFVYVSNVNNYKDYGFTAPTRVVGEGAILTLDGTPKALVPREDQMNISAGKDQWYKTQLTLSADLTKEELTVIRLKTTSEQGTQSQALTSKIKNNVVFVSYEPILESLGWIDNVFGEPQLTDISYSIVNDFNATDFTDGEVRYHKNYIYVSAPKSSKVFVYNMTNPDNKYWEAPQVLPVGRFSVIDGDLYGHSYQSSETYKLFTGYNDNGNFIQANAVLAFNSHGIRHASKGFNQYFVEGYISTNTTLQLGLQYDIDGCATITAFNILGNDAQIVCLGSDDNLLGKYNLGKVPLGANIAQATTTPSKFRVIVTMPKVPYYEYQVSFNSVGFDQNWEVLAFGCAWQRTFEGNNYITK